MIDAYHLAAVATRDDLRRAIARYAPRSPQAALLGAVVAQYDGDVDGAVSALRHLMRSVAGADLAAVADTLAPMLVMRHDNDGVVALAGIIEGAGWIAPAYALRALAAADSGNRSGAREHASVAEVAVAEERDDVIRFRVLQRLARAAYYIDEHERAVDLALASAALASRMGAWRAAGAGYSIAYNVHHSVTGDAEEADRYARLFRAAASKANDDSFAQTALVAEYELAVQFADLARIDSLERLIRARLLPQQYTERFPLALSHAIVRGATDLLAMRTLLQVLREVPGRSRGQWALCTALIAVAEAARADDDLARRSLRAAIARLGRVAAADPAHERRYRRLARAAVGVACMLLGDDVRAARTVAARESLAGDGEDRLPALMRARELDGVPLALRGIARVFAAAFQVRSGLESPAGLTKAEVEVLRLLGQGWSAGRIARETQRSVNTVYNHTRSILWKLDASRAAEAVAIARERGVLT
ncbi:MAG TPA: LuxR C-terminal-related transcriptional regulator [Candidatus Elarobacter sp.]|jgi:DNA-binding NarL/FixJ family response regulator